MHAPLASLAAHWHACKGELPPPLVGASVTLVDVGPGSGAAGKLYLFGGRLVSTRKMVADLFELDLATLTWSRVDVTSGTVTSSGEGSAAAATRQQQRPQPRYFHSSDLWQGQLIFFGGMGYASSAASGSAAAGASGADVNDAKSPTTGEEPSSADSLCVLDEIIAFDLTTRRWELNFAPAASSTANLAHPVPRYAHLSSTTTGKLVIIGGQNMANQYVEEINVFDLKQRRWTLTHTFTKQCGSYRSLAVAGRLRVEDPDASSARNSSGAAGSSRNTRSTAGRGGGGGGAGDENGVTSPRGASSSSYSGSGSTGRVNSAFTSTPPSSAALPTGDAGLDLLSMSREPIGDDGQEEPLPLYVYTNYNFTDVKRELELVDLKPASPAAAAGNGVSSAPSISVKDRSAEMTGASLPPGLRFPTGAILGPHLLISGTYLANTSQTFSVWSLHMPTMQWSRLDVGALLSTGSWNRAVLWPTRSRLVIFGHRGRDLVSDYNHRQTNWDHVLVLELEAWGISQPPLRPASDAAIGMGLESLSAATVGSFAASLPGGGLDDLAIRSGGFSEAGSRASGSLPTLPLSLGGRGDFEIVCADGMRLGCHRALLERRWPWFAARMREYRKRARKSARVTGAAFKARASSDADTAGGRSRSALSGSTMRALQSDTEDEEADSRASIGANGSARNGSSASMRGMLPVGSHRNSFSQYAQSDPRLTPRQLHIAEPSPVVLALLQYIYAGCICTPLQRHPAIIASLLLLATLYGMPDLDAWARHAAHVALTRDLGPPTSSSGAAPVTPTATSADAGFSPAERHRLAVVLYETAALCGHEALQIRALRTVMAISKWVQRSSARAPAAVDESGPTTPTTVSAVSDLASSSGMAKGGGPYSPTSARPPLVQRWSLTGGQSTIRGQPPQLAPPPAPPLDNGATGEDELSDDLDSPLPVRRPSKAERMLGISASQSVSSKAERMLGLSGSEASNVGLTPRSGSSFSSAQATAPPHSASSQTSLRKASNAPSSMLSVRSPGNGMAKKRFSLFGRSSDNAPVPVRAMDELDVSEESRPSLEQGSLMAGVRPRAATDAGAHLTESDVKALRGLWG